MNKEFKQFLRIGFAVIIALVITLMFLCISSQNSFGLPEYIEIDSQTYPINESVITDTWRYIYYGVDDYCVILDGYNGGSIWNDII